MPAAADLLSAAGDVLDEHLGRSTRFRVAVLVREANNRVGVANVHVRGVRPSGIKGDSKRKAQAGREHLVHLGFAVAVSVAQNLDPVGHALGNEEVAVGGRDDLARVSQADGEFGDLESPWAPAAWRLRAGARPSGNCSPTASRMAWQDRRS